MQRLSGHPADGDAQHVGAVTVGHLLAELVASSAGASSA